MDASASTSATTIPSTSIFTPLTSLCPGYKQVDAFNTSDDCYSDDDEADISYVTLDLGNIEPTLVPSSSTYRIIGLDTSTPFLQLSGTILKGKHDSLLGTELLFTDGKDIDTSKRSTVYTGSTSQRISFREVQLVPKGSPTSPPSSPVNGKSKTKGKRKAADGNDEPESPIVREDVHMVDRVTGKLAPKARALRGMKAKAKMDSDKEEVEDEAVEKGGGSKKRPKPRAKGKGKAKKKDAAKVTEEAVLNQDGDEDRAGAGPDGMDVDEG